MTQKFQIGQKVKFVGYVEAQEYLFLIGSVGEVVAYFENEDWGYKITCNNVEYVVSEHELENHV